MKPTLARRVERAFAALPAWLRPAVFCASAATILFLVRVVVAVPALITGRATLSELGLALAAVVGAGFAGGLVHGVSRPPLRRLGKVGDYASGVAILYGYLGSLMLASPFVFESSAIPKSAGEAGFWLALATVLGVIFGHMLYAGPEGIDRLKEQRSMPRVTRLQHDEGARTATMVSGWIRRADLEPLLGDLARTFGGGLPPGELARIDQALAALSDEDEEGVECRVGERNVPVHLVPDEDLVQIDVLLEDQLESAADSVGSLLGARTVDPLAV
jgi:hypothetical protein